jgi:hypothetical protein
MWTPNAFVNEITEEGFRADPLIPGTVTPAGLDEAIIAGIARTASQGGFVGTLVARDQAGAMITAELNEFDAEGRQLDYVAYNAVLEAMRAKHEDAGFEIQIIGFAKQIGDIADGAAAVLEFCADRARAHGRCGVLVQPVVAVHAAAGAVLAGVTGLAVRHAAAAGLWARSAGCAGALPGVRHRRVPWGAADQHIVREISQGKSAEASARAASAAC